MHTDIVTWHWSSGVSLQVGNLGLLFMLLFFIFAALGVELFGDLSKDTCRMQTGKPDKVQTAAFRQNIPPSACTGMHQILHFPICEFNQFDVNCVRESLSGLCPWSLRWVQIARLGNTIRCCHSWCPIKSFCHRLSASPSVCDELHPCEGLGRYATFRNFGMAFLLLFRVSTGDNWNGIMKVKATLDWRTRGHCCLVLPHSYSSRPLNIFRILAEVGVFFCASLKKKNPIYIEQLHNLLSSKASVSVPVVDVPFI